MSLDEIGMGTAAISFRFPFPTHERICVIFAQISNYLQLIYVFSTLRSSFSTHRLKSKILFEFKGSAQVELAPIDFLSSVITLIDHGSKNTHFLADFIKPL